MTTAILVDLLSLNEKLYAHFGIRQKIVFDNLLDAIKEPDDTIQSKIILANTSLFTGAPRLMSYLSRNEWRIIRIETGRDEAFQIYCQLGQELDKLSPDDRITKIVAVGHRFPPDDLERSAAKGNKIVLVVGKGRPPWVEEVADEIIEVDDIAANIVIQDDWDNPAMYRRRRG